MYIEHCTMYSALCTVKSRFFVMETTHIIWMHFTDDKLTNEHEPAFTVSSASNIIIVYSKSEQKITTQSAFSICIFLVLGKAFVLNVVVFLSF